ncbi:MAG: response regulator transcription factor [Campylobacteraceae bacterium]|nr:response regulator transcription factor [Campylobacteraceae bacterium]
MKQKILIIDDDKAIRKMLTITLEASGFEPIEASSLAEAVNKAALYNPSVALLDLGLPDGSGMEFLGRFREWSAAPVIILSAIGMEEQKISALEAGADDYLVKPFGTGELIARIKASLRRSEQTQNTSVITSKNLELDIGAHTATIDGEELKLTPKEYELLKTLLKNKGKILTHSWLLKEIC